MPEYQEVLNNFWKPTGHLRWINREEPVLGNPSLSKTVLILQQEFINLEGSIKWRDIPIVNEEENAL